MLIKTFNVFPEGLYIDSILKFARDELTQEVDYRNEAKHQTRFRELVLEGAKSTDEEQAKLMAGMYVPFVVHNMSTARVLTQVQISVACFLSVCVLTNRIHHFPHLCLLIYIHFIQVTPSPRYHRTLLQFANLQEYVEGVAVDKIVAQPSPSATASPYSDAVRQSVGRRLMFLTLKELFEWRYVQSDPNWGNFLYDARRDRVCLLDFGACRSYAAEFVTPYMQLVHACASRDEQQIWDMSKRLGFVTGSESKRMRAAHTQV
jgi:aarF domain-containing kinase